MKEKSGTYKLLHIIMLESYFKREANIDFNNVKFHNDIDLQMDSKQQDLLLYVSVTLHFNARSGDKILIGSKISMTGLFEIPKEKPVLSVEDFSKINAPAIIFPFIREHLANMSMKAGIQPILLPPINFVKLAEEK